MNLASYKKYYRYDQDFESYITQCMLEFAAAAKKKLNRDF